MGRWIKVISALFVLGGLLVAVAGAVLTEGSLRVRRTGNPAVDVQRLSDEDRNHWTVVEVVASDGVRLRGWFTHADNWNRRCVLLLHGISDSRQSAIAAARMLARHGYAGLAVDGRAHGESGGDLVTYGIYESGDTGAWVRWLERNGCSAGIYALGESLGAAVLLQSLPREPLIRAAVAECAFRNFSEIARDRVAQQMPLPFQASRLAAGPIVWSAFHYVRWKYGLDFSGVSPEHAVAQTGTPVLLIHGLADTNILPRHTEAIVRRNPKISVWYVANAGHTAAYGTVPDEFERRVVAWFDTH